MPIAETSIVDPVCGRPVDPLRARAVGIFGGQTKYFCSATCKAEYAKSGAAVVVEPKPAAKAPPPKPVLPDVPLIAARPAVAPPVERVVAPPRPRTSTGPFVIAAIVLAALAVAVWLRPRPQAPVVSMPVVAAKPVVPAPAPAPTPIAKPVAVTASVPSYDGALKLGLRRFVEGTAWSLRLVLIDDAGTPTVVTIATGEGAATDGAVAPEPDFARNRREPGVVFKAADVEIERRATELVVRAGTGEKVVAHLTEATALRAAPFARARYDEK